MAYPRKLLNADEEVVFDLHPHWKQLVGPTLLAPVVVFVAAFGASKIPDGSSQGTFRWVVTLAALVVLFFTTVRPYLRWYSTHFVLTTRRVIMREGLIARKGRDIPIFRINDVTFSHTVVERIFGAGTLMVESAGERGQVTLHDIPHVEDVQREIYTLMDADDARRRSGSATAEAEPDS